MRPHEVGSRGDEKTKAGLDGRRKAIYGDMVEKMRYITWILGLFPENWMLKSFVQAHF